MKIPQIIFVFLILVSLLLAGCTDRKPKTSDSSADLPKPTITSGTPETSQPNTQATPASETDSRTPETSTPTDPLESTEDHETAAVTSENTSDADPVEPETTDDPGGIPVEEDATIIASGDVEFIGGD